MKFSTALKLGRVSNLPTVWTNTLVGLALSTAAISWQTACLAAAAFSLFYLAGMFLNDAFDAEWDRVHGNARPIPQGEASKTSVVYFAVAFLIAAFPMVGLISAHPFYSLSLALVLLSCILLYDYKHKQWPRIAPWLMGACRFALYLCAASLVGLLKWGWAHWLVAASMLLYIAGITALARAEHENRVAGLVLPLLLLFAPCVLAFVLGYKSTHSILVTFFALAWTVRAVLEIQSGKPACVPRAVAALLAGIALIDAAFLFALQAHIAGVMALFAFILCLLLQTRIAAT